ncbi:hypothetical protein CTAYLR_010233 [Chrysophaeum taylorii]|uniref:Ribosome recycling factor domain-containing protein n=1 Tax=Chrysophaeum taylorii TaxID=2483200 RepID=A0AAD7U622_9STRA|nr:hypothetical protein CTAYLR_010233 [Chrysophaeum taylorii]
MLLRRIILRAPPTRSFAKKKASKRAPPPAQEDTGELDVLSSSFADGVKEKMDATVSALDAQLSRLRGSKPTPALFASTRVEAYGGYQPLSALAQVSVKSATLVEVACYDPQIATGVADALRKLDGLSLNPQVSGGTISIPFPRPSHESREAVAKAATQAADAAKQRARKVRHKAQDEIKKHATGLSEDDVHRQHAVIDKLTEDTTKRLTALVDAKKADILKPH